MVNLKTNIYDEPSVKEKIFKYLFHHHIFGGENIFKYIFTTVFLGEKIYLNLFSPLYFWGNKYIWIYFHHRILGGESIFKYIFTTVFWGEKIYLNLFSAPYFWGRKYIKIYFHHRIFGVDHYRKGRKYISSNGWLPGSLSYWYGELSLYQYSEMTLGTEIGETSYNMLTIYPIQSNHSGKGLLMMNTLWPQSRTVYDFLRNAAPTYTHNYGCREWY